MHPETGKRFRLLADLLYDGNKSELARSMGMEPGSFTKYTRGDRRPGARVLERLTRLGVNVNWFLTGDGPVMIERPRLPPSEQPLADAGSPVSASDLLDDPRQYYPVPLVEVRMGDEGTVFLAKIGDPEWLSGSFIRHQYGIEPGRLRTFRVSCNWMADTIRPGDRIRMGVLDSDRPHGEILPGHVYVLFGPGGVFTARICETDETSDILLVGDNPEVDDRQVSSQQWREAYRPIARVLEVVRPL